MSFLLDALRKSESQKHRGHAPTIHSTAGLESRSGRRRSYWPIVILLVPVVVVLAWMGWKNFAATDTGELPSVQVAANTVSKEVRADLKTSAPELPSVPRPAVTGKGPVSSRTAVENFAGQEEVVSGSPGSTPSPKDVQDSPESSSPSDPGPGSGTDETSTETLPALSGEPKETTDPQSHLSTVNYWELPESIREQIPGLKISVLVYAQNAKDRFILMNGRRFAEKDEPSNGLILSEIRRDGAVFSFRHYRFLVTR